MVEHLRFIFDLSASIASSDRFWQLVTVFLVAYLTQFFIEHFRKKRERKKELRELIGEIVYNGRVAHMYAYSYLQAMLNFKNATDELSEFMESKDRDSSVLDALHSRVMTNNENAMDSRRALETARAKMLKSFYMLNSLENEEVISNDLVKLMNKFNSRILRDQDNYADISTEVTEHFNILFKQVEPRLFEILKKNS